MFSPVLTKGEGDGAVSKPLHECNLDECLELKGILFEKYQKLSAIGKGGSALQFLRYIQQVDERVQALQIEISRQEAEKAKAKKDQTRAQESKSARKGGYNPNRWTRGTPPPDQRLPVPDGDAEDTL